MLLKPPNNRKPSSPQFTTEYPCRGDGLVAVSVPSTSMLSVKWDFWLQSAAPYPAWHRHDSVSCNEGNKNKICLTILQILEQTNDCIRFKRKVLNNYLSDGTATIMSLRDHILSPEAWDIFNTCRNILIAKSHKNGNSCWFYVGKLRKLDIAKDRLF